MPRDYGDPNPSDNGDVKPAAPTTDYSETNTRRIGTPDNRVTPRNTGFNTDVRPDQIYQPVRHSFMATVVDGPTNGYYSVILQNGKEVYAFDPYAVSGYTYVEAQTVVLVTGQRADEYVIVGQKFNQNPTVEYVKLTEILIVGDKAKGKRMLSLGQNGWQETEEEVTVYDTFYQNYGLKTEVLPYTYNVGTQTATFVGEHGLIRLGVASSSIAANSSGDIQVYDKDGEVTDAIINASFTWMHNNQTIASGKEVIVKWFIEHDDWLIIGREC